MTKPTRQDSMRPSTPAPASGDSRGQFTAPEGKSVPNSAKTTTKTAPKSRTKQTPRRASRPPSRPVASAPPPSPHTIMLDGVPVPYTLRVSARARRLRFVIRPTSGLEVVAPRGVGQARIEEGLRAKAQWILTTSARMAQQTPPTPTPLTTGRILPYLGRRLLLIVHTGAPKGRYRASLSMFASSAPDAHHIQPPLASPGVPRHVATRRAAPGKGHDAAHGFIQGRLDFTPSTDATTSSAAPEVDGALTLTVASNDEATVRAALEAWYRRQAQAIVVERLALWNQRYGFTYHRVTIKEQKTRWGSCSRQGNLNFNWRLLLAPLEVLDYVLIHELSHLKEQNHSPRFWAVVALACPDYRARRHWLREHGHELRF